MIFKIYSSEGVKILINQILNESLLKKAIHIVSYERLSFLNHVDEKSLNSGTLLDLQHQTILRIIYQYDKLEFPSVMEKYSSSFFERKNILEKAKSFFKETLKDFLPENLGITGDCYQSIKLSISDAFAKILNRPSGEIDKTISFVNEFGFGIFPIADEKDGDFSTLSYIDDQNLASVGAMMFYVTNFKDQNSFYFLRSSIDVLAHTFLEYFKGMPKEFDYDFRNENISRELKQLPNEFCFAEKIRDCVIHFLTCHEKGHIITYAGNKRILEIFNNFEIPTTEFYQADFPDSHDLKAWSRVKVGECTPRDVSFLFWELFSKFGCLRNERV